MDYPADFCYVFVMKRYLKIIFKEDVQKIFDHFSSTFDMKILFYSPDGEIIKVGLNRPNALYCRLMQDNLFGVDACRAIDRKGQEEAKNLKRTVDHFCHAGVKDIITPIFSNGALLGFIGFGQFRQNRKIPLPVMTGWTRRGGGYAELKEAYYKLPYYSKEKEKHIKELFMFLFNYIVSQHMIMAKGHVIIQKALSYIQDHIEEPVQLGEVAAAVGRSRSTVSHLFKSKLDMGFKKTVMTIRFEKAEEYFRTSPHLKVKEVAEKIGYEDPLYFSRVFKKYRKLCPRQYIRHLDAG